MAVNQETTISGKVGAKLLVLPRIVHLVYSLIRDPRVPKKKKLGLLGGLFYLVFPYDLLPESHFPHLGLADDFIILLRVLRRLLVDVDPAIVAGHWKGTPEELEFVRNALTRGDDFIAGLGKRILGEESKSQDETGISNV